MKKVIVSLLLLLSIGGSVFAAAPKKKTIKMNERVYFSGMVNKKLPAGEGTMAIFLTPGIGKKSADFLEALVAFNAIPVSLRDSPDYKEAEKTFKKIPFDLIEGIFQDGKISQGKLTLSKGAVVKGEFLYEISDNQVVFHISNGELVFKDKWGDHRFLLDSPTTFTRLWSESKAFLLPNMLSYETTVELDGRKQHESAILNYFLTICEHPKCFTQTLEPAIDLNTGELSYKSGLTHWDFGDGRTGIYNKDDGTASLSGADSTSIVSAKLDGSTWKVEQFHWKKDNGEDIEVISSGAANRISRKEYLTRHCANWIDSSLSARLNAIPQDELNSTISQGNDCAIIRKDDGAIICGLFNDADLGKLSDIVSCFWDSTPRLNVGISIDADGNKSVQINPDLTLEQREETYRSYLALVKQQEEEAYRSHLALVKKLKSNALLGDWEDYIRYGSGGLLMQGIFHLKKNGVLVYETKCYMDIPGSKMVVYLIVCMDGTYKIKDDKFSIHINKNSAKVKSSNAMYAKGCTLTQEQKKAGEAYWHEYEPTIIDGIKRSNVESDFTGTVDSFTDSRIHFKSGKSITRPIQDITQYNTSCEIMFIAED